MKSPDNLPDPDVIAQEIVEAWKPQSNNSAKSPPIWEEQRIKPEDV